MTELTSLCVAPNSSNKLHPSSAPRVLMRVYTLVHFLVYAAAAAAKSFQLCLTLCDPIDGSLQGSPIPGILQARILEWVAISFSNA